MPLVNASNLSGSQRAELLSTVRATTHTHIDKQDCPGTKSQGIGVETGLLATSKTSRSQLYHENAQAITSSKQLQIQIHTTVWEVGLEAHACSGICKSQKSHRQNKHICHLSHHLQKTKNLSIWEARLLSSAARWFLLSLNILISLCGMI